MRAWLALAIASLAAHASAQPEGWTRRLDLAHGAFVHALAPEAIVHARGPLDPARPLRLVVFLHGYRGCVELLAAQGPARCRPGAPPRPGWDLLARHDEADRGTLFVLAQLALDARDGSPGRFVRPGGFRAFIDELLSSVGTEIGVSDGLGRLGSITLVAHSAGFRAALAILRAADLSDEVRHVVLLDALYAGTSTFLDWARASPDRRLVSLHAGVGPTGARNRELARRARRALGEQAAVGADATVADASDHRVVVARVATPHGHFAQRHLAEVLRALLPVASPSTRRDSRAMDAASSGR